MNKFIRRRVVAGTVATLVTVALTVLFVRVPVASASDVPASLPTLVAVDTSPVNPCEDVAARCDLSTVFPDGARFALSVVPSGEFVCAGQVARMVTVWIETADGVGGKVSAPACSPVIAPLAGGVPEVLHGLFYLSAALTY